MVDVLIAIGVTVLLFAGIKYAVWLANWNRPTWGKVIIGIFSIWVVLFIVIFASGYLHGWKYGYYIGMTYENMMNMGNLKAWIDSGKPQWYPYVFAGGLPAIGSLMVGAHEYYWYFNLIAKIDKWAGKPYPGIGELNDWAEHNGHIPCGIVPKNKRLLVCGLEAINGMRLLFILTFVGCWLGVVENAFNKSGNTFLWSRRADDVTFIIGVVMLAAVMVITTI